MRKRKASRIETYTNEPSQKSAHECAEGRAENHDAQTSQNRATAIGSPWRRRWRIESLIAEVERNHTAEEESNLREAFGEEPFRFGHDAGLRTQSGDRHL